MKVKELLEDVADFAQHRAKRDAIMMNAKKHRAVNQRHDDIDEEDDAETLTVHELAEFEEYTYQAKAMGRVPGFTTMDDAVCYLLSDLEMPHHITRSSAIKWFQSLSEEERGKARMMAHHADRMIRIYEMLKTKLRGLQDTWKKRFGQLPKGWDCTESAAWLDSELSYDISHLKNLDKAITILGH